MISSNTHHSIRLLMAAFVVAAVTVPAIGQDRKKKENQSEQAQKAIQKQKDIAKGLGEKAAGDPAVAQKQLDEAKAALQAEKDRHAADLVKLNAELKAATDAGQSQKVKNTTKAIERETEQHAKKVESLQKAVDAAQAKVDGK